MDAPHKREIDHRTLKLIVGLIALLLAPVTQQLAGGTLTSISAAYHAAPHARDVLVGSLFAIASFLAAYNGERPAEMILSKIAALAALGVALDPCACDARSQVHAGLTIHGLSAAVMFLVLALMCGFFYGRARAKGYAQARLRAAIYLACGLIIVASVLVIALDYRLGGIWSAACPRLVFWGEAAGLTAFGLAWLTASRVLPGIARPDERFAPWR